MKQFQLKQPERIEVLGQTFEGDYIQAVNGSTYSIVPKADFEAKYEEVPQVAAEAPKPEAAAQQEPAQAAQPNQNNNHLV